MLRCPLILQGRWLLLCSAVVLSTMLTLPASAQIEDSVLVHVRSLMADGAYASAYRLLEKHDPDHVSAAAGVLRTDIVLQGFTKSIGHQLFGLKDLGPDEDLSTLRNSNGSFEMVSYPANEELTNLLITHPVDIGLHRALADFLFDAGSKYGDNWVMESDSLNALVAEHYRFVNDHGGGDATSWYRQGFAWLAIGRADSAVGPLTTAVELDPKKPEWHYNLAYANMQLNQRETAIREAQVAYAIDADGPDRADAARLVGIMYEEMEATDSASHWLALADKVDPNNYYTLQALLTNAIKAHLTTEPAIRDRFFSIAPENPSTYDDLERLYANDEAAMVTFYRQHLSAADNSPLVNANLHFFLGRLLLDSDMAAAKTEFAAAREEFAKALPADHEVFEMIDELLSQ